jgi:4-alpha-glucanotransferase
MQKRGSGILLHITSLPSPFGIGDVGPASYEFVNFLEETNQIYWQVLPLNPTSLISGNSPYASFSAFAGNTLLISPENLKELDLLAEGDLSSGYNPSDVRVNFPVVTSIKSLLYKKAYQSFKNNFHKYQQEYDLFCIDNTDWLEDYACFIAFKTHFKDKVWSKWDKDIRDRNASEMSMLKEKLFDEIRYHKFLQFIFFKQWSNLKRYANEKGIQIIGDIPYYVNYDSSEVWMSPDLFKLDNKKKPRSVAGVPPDYFSETGQLWGNPVYDWENMKKSKYSWWIKRLKQNLKLYDIIRIDHFRGFSGYWEVQATEKTAINGKWIRVPGEEIFQIFREHFTDLPILAEDLGVITEDVRELMEKFNLPGMRILLFAFDENLPNNAYAPHHHIRDCVVYTGTHDNNTTKGWFLEETNDADRRRLAQYLGKRVSADKISWDFIRMAMGSVANTIIIPLQDVLGLDSQHRMNKPATLDGNWEWRLLPGQLDPIIIEKLKEMTILFGRKR